MGATPGSPRTPTVLAHKIAERNMTVEEFAAYAETFAREHDEPGTLSHRHLQRLVLSDGTVPNLRPATRRLLEALFALPVSELLAPDSGGMPSVEEDDLTHRLDAARRVDAGVVRLFSEQLDGIRKMDRQFGAEYLLGTVRGLIGQMDALLRYSTSGATARALAGVLSQAYTLAGWQSLDRLHTRAAWEHYQSAITAARAAESPPPHARALAEQSVVLMDIECPVEAIELAAHALDVGTHCSPLVRCWLAAMHSETIASQGDADSALRTFDTAVPAAGDECDPFLVLDGAHLKRWHGHILSISGRSEALPVLDQALSQHRLEFCRANAVLHLDLERALLVEGDREAAASQADNSAQSAALAGSLRIRAQPRQFFRYMIDF